MIIRLKRKTFSTDFNQLSNEQLAAKATGNKKYKRNNTIGYGLAGAGIGAAAGIGVATNRLLKKAPTAINAAGEELLGRVLGGNAQPLTGRLAKVQAGIQKVVPRAAGVGALAGTAALGTLGYLRGRAKTKKREAKRSALLSRMNQAPSAGY